MDRTYAMLFDEVRHALAEIRLQRYREAIRTLEGVLLVEELVRRCRRRDPEAIRLSRLLLFEREWERSPEWLKEQARLRMARAEEVFEEELRDADRAI